MEIEFKPFTPRLQLVDAKTREILTGLPNNLFYHVTDHTLNPFIGVVAMAHNYASLVDLPSEQRELVVVSAYLHDTGYTIKYKNNELEGSVIAGDILPACNFTKGEIAVVQKTIISAGAKEKPRNMLEMILSDADHDNIGRADFFEKNKLLFKELCVHGIFDYTEECKKEWLNQSLYFLCETPFYTTGANQLRGLGKLRNIRKLSYLLRNS
ncbi:HD domain-containing protein [Candidatus Woesearchaeota archaeon]|nr:HD domain-containing protein [Candidatus Woesearchaeota archaeon]